MRAIIPDVSSIEKKNTVFTLTANSRILVIGDNAVKAAKLLADYLRPSTGYSLPVISNDKADAADIILSTTGKDVFDEAGFSDESYNIDISDHGCRVSALTAQGLSRAIQTLRQLFPVEIFSMEMCPGIAWEIAGCHIEDAPEFRWRGMHLDVGRHFFSREEVCRFIDLMALHRMNRFHFHLTEDQGWRIEIRKYPKLTEIGSKREATLSGHYYVSPRSYDETPYSGYYTQQDIRDIVAYAAEREIEIVPEIDMPGHMQAAIASYPHLGCTDISLKPLCHWGISQHILNPEESTISFMKDVLDEVMELFPGRFIHVGGDEAPKYEWAESRRIQERMRELGVKNEEELQSWFIKQMDQHISSKGRRLIGWDEILEGGLASGAAVMSWRGEDGGIKAAKMKHNVVMTPSTHVYFDFYQSERSSEEPLAIGGCTTTEKVYAYKVEPAALTEDQKQYILGSQGQLWTEYIPDMKILEYRSFPRLCALSEVLWVNEEKKNYSSFLERLKTHRMRLELLKVNAHPRP